MVVSMTDNVIDVKTIKQNSKKDSGNGMSIRLIGAIATVVAIALSFVAFTIAGYVSDAKDLIDEYEGRFITCNEAINELQDASNYLTTQARMFVTTGRKSCMDAYIEELNDIDRRGNALTKIKASFSDDIAVTTELTEALEASDSLAKNELVAMKLAAGFYGYESVPTTIENASLGKYASLKRADKLDAAKELVLGDEYERAKNDIAQNVEASSQALLENLNTELGSNNAHMENLLFQLRIVVALLLCVVMLLVLVVLLYVLKPLTQYIKRIEQGEPLEANGSYELHYLANAYNNMYENNSQRLEQLRELAERDPLTGISNRSGYDGFLATHTRNIALLLIDIDNFKEFNHVYGNDTGDAVLIKLANALSTAFRSTDFPCRLESDMFAVIMTNVNASLHDTVAGKLELVNSILANDSDNLPLITLSVGVAFSTEGMSDRDIYRAAESALHHVQNNGRNGLAFYGESN